LPLHWVDRGKLSAWVRLGKILVRLSQFFRDSTKIRTLFLFFGRSPPNRDGGYND
jgi:hypothetical protein